MKKHIFFLLSLICSVSVYANVVTGVAAVPAGYYNAVDGKSNADAILDALFNKIKGHNVINYNALEDYYEQTDFIGDTVWDMYSTCRFTMADANKQQKAVCDAWNKEHSIPQSWFNEGSPMKSDLFHVYPTDARVNNFRSNLPYGEVSGSNGTGFPDNFGGHGLGKKGANTFPGYTGTVFEPADEYKGDFARTYFYMVARYRDKALNSSGGSAVFTTGSTNLTEYAKNLFLQWHRNDPVSQKEIDRNQAVYGIQHNRNPFIDYPELAEYIWGNKVGQAIDLSSMVPTCDGGGYDPGQVTKYGVRWVVCGSVIHTDSVIAQRAVPALPETPVSCLATSETFMGWTSAPIIGTTDEAPVLYRTLSDIPVITEDRTLYAVFAHGEQAAAVTPATYTYDENNQSGWTNSGTWTSSSFWLLDAGKSLVSPEVNLAGLDTIQVRMRTYGGTSYCNLEVKAGETLVATIVATEGKTMTNYRWVKAQQPLSGSSPLTFTCRDAIATKGIGFQSVVIKATGAGVIYSAFYTGSDVASGRVAQQPEMIRRVLIKDGQLLIQVGEQFYTATGQRLQ